MRAKTIRLIVLNPENPELDLVFFASDWEKLKNILQDQLLSPNFLEVEYELELSRRGRVKYIEEVMISDNKFKEKYFSIEMYYKLSSLADDTRILLKKASEIAPDDVNVTIDDIGKEVRIYINNIVSVKIADRARYIVVYINKLPNEVSKEIEVLLQRKGFKRGAYGGLIARAKVELRKLAEELKNIIEKYESEIKRMFEEEIVAARNTLLWVDEWDPSKSIEEDVREKLEGKQEEAEEAVEAVEETASTEEIGKRILEEVEGVGVEVELEAETETTAVVSETEEEKPRKQELVKIYLLKMRLPSKYLVQQVKIEKNGEGFREIRDFSKREVAMIASRLEGIRRTAYEKVSNMFVFVESYGMWIAVTEKAVERAREVSKWIVEELKALKIDANRYFVKAIPIYLEIEEARELLSEAIRLLFNEKRELEEKIREAEENKKRSILRKLERKLEYKQALLESFKKYLEQLS